MLNRNVFESAQSRYPFAALHEIVYFFLREAIITMELEPGKKLSESQIAEELNISRSPVKAAIERLQQDMLVERAPGKSAYVAGIYYHDCCDLLEARRGIESYAAFYAASRITDGELRELKQCLLTLRIDKTCFDPVEYARADDAFHNLIVQASRSRYLIDAYHQIQSSLLRYRLFIVRKLDISELHEFSAYVPVYHAIQSRYSTVARDEMLVLIDRMAVATRVIESAQPSQRKNK